MLVKIENIRKENKEEVINRLVNSKICWLSKLFGKKPMTRADAEKLIEKTDYPYSYYGYSPDIHKKQFERCELLGRYAYVLLKRDPDIKMELSVEDFSLLGG